MSERTARRALAVILVLFMGLGGAYALTTPTLEAPDEIHHYNYVRSLVNTGRPPVLKKGGGRGFGHHAPLYYAYSALTSFWVGENDLKEWSERYNPFFGYRFGDVGRDNKNLYLHPDADFFGRSDTWLGVRVVRLASVLLGATTIWAIYRVGREVFPHRLEMALGAAGLSAFIPEFLFISGAVNDDNGATLFGTLALWAMVRILRKGPNWRRCVALGLALGLGWLSKLTIVALVPTAGLTLMIAAHRERSWRVLFRRGMVIFGVAALLIVPWLVRQTVLYGDPTGTAREMTEWGLRERPPTLADLGPDLYWLRTSFWGRLGHNQIPLSEWIYNLLDVATVAALAGFIYLVARRRSSPVQRSQFTILVAAFLFTFGPMVVRRFLRPMPNFGRYLYPVLSSISLVMFTGLAAWLPRRRHLHLTVGIILAMLALGVGGLICFLAPAYARPPVYDASSAPEPAHRLDWTYLADNRPLARLRGYDLSEKVVKPGETVRVTLYWEVLKETSMDYVLFAQLFGQGGAKVGQRDTYPGLGHYPTSFWQTGHVVVDEVPIRVDADAAAPSRLRLDVGLYVYESGRRLTVMDEAGNPVGAPTVGWLKLASIEEVAPPAFSTDYRLGDAIALIGYDLEQEPPSVSKGPEEALRLTLYWACLAPLDRDYTVFVHLIGPDGALKAQADGPPVGGDYPTSFWSPNEIITDGRSIPIKNLPPGTYHLNLGMYLLETGERLPATDADGARLSNNVVPLTKAALP